MELLKNPKSLSECPMKETEGEVTTEGPKSARELATQGIPRTPGWHSAGELQVPPMQ